MTASEPYIAAAYLVAVVLLLTCVLIIAAKLQRLERAIYDLQLVGEAAPDEPALGVAPRPAGAWRAGSAGSRRKSAGWSSR